MNVKQIVIKFKRKHTTKGASTLKIKKCTTAPFWTLRKSNLREKGINLPSLRKINLTFSILACIFALMSSTELGPFGVLGLFSCFLKDSWP